MRFKIVTYDNAGNKAVKDGAEPYCTYQVIREFPSLIRLLLFVMATLLVAILLKRRKHSAARVRRDL